MAPYLWSTMGEAGQTLSEAEAFAIGTERIASRINTQQIVVVGEPGHAEAALMGYAVEAEDPITSETPAMFQPLIALENQVVGSWYVNVLATRPQARDRGLGRALLSIAEDLAREAGLRTMSIIVSDSNSGARRLYERLGYRAIAERAKVKAEWDGPGQTWILMTKAVSVV